MGFDIHEPSIDGARRAAAEAGVSQRTRFEVAPAKDFPGEGYDLVCLFDALHDMGDSVGAARRIRQALAPDGTLLLVEPNAGDALEDDLNPVGRTYYGLSTVICTPGSLSQEVRLGLGARAGERQLTMVLREAGFTHVPGHRDPVQHHPGGQTMGVAPIVASTDSPRARCSPPMKTSVRAHW